MTIAPEAEPKMTAIKSCKNKMSISTAAGAIIIKSRKRAYAVLIHHRLIMAGKGQIIKTGMEDKSSPKNGKSVWSGWLLSPVGYTNTIGSNNDGQELTLALCIDLAGQLRAPKTWGQYDMVIRKVLNSTGLN